jgi:hypothetical protein
MASMYEQVPLYKVIKPGPITIPTSLTVTNLRAIIHVTKATLKSTGIMANMASNLPSIKRSPDSAKGLTNVTSPGQTPV